MKKLNLLIISLTAFAINAVTQEVVVADVLPEVGEVTINAETVVIAEDNAVVNIETQKSHATGIGSNKREYYDGYPFQHLAIGINVGLYGLGFEINTPIIPNIKARAGLNYIGLNLESFGFSAFEVDGFDYIDANGVKQKEAASADIMPELKFLNGKLLFDFLPSKKGIFAFTAGVYIGQNKIGLTGTAYEWIDEQRGDLLTNATLNFGDGIIVHTDANGEVDAHVRWGNVVKPYFGLTLGRAIPKHRVGFKFELGAVYQKAKFTLLSDGGTGEAVAEANDNMDSILDNLPKGVSKALNFWPMLSMQLTYKLW